MVSYVCVCLYVQRVCSFNGVSFSSCLFFCFEQTAKKDELQQELIQPLTVLLRALWGNDNNKATVGITPSTQPAEQQTTTTTATESSTTAATTTATTATAGVSPLASIEDVVGLGVLKRLFEEELPQCKASLGCLINCFGYSREFSPATGHMFTLAMLSLIVLFFCEFFFSVTVTVLFVFVTPIDFFFRVSLVAQHGGESIVLQMALLWNMLPVITSLRVRVTRRVISCLVLSCHVMNLCHETWCIFSCNSFTLACYLSFFFAASVDV